MYKFFKKLKIYNKICLTLLLMLLLNALGPPISIASKNFRTNNIIVFATPSATGHVNESSTNATKSKFPKLPENKKDEFSRDKLKESIEKIDGGSKFEKIIAKLLVSVQADVLWLINSVTGFSSIDKVIFNRGLDADGRSPITAKDWQRMSTWYKFMILISESILFIAIIIISTKFFRGSYNSYMRTEALDSLKRLLGASALILLSPYLIHLLIYINNSFTYLFAISSPTNTSIDSSLSAMSVIDKMQASSPLAAVLIIGIFIFLQLKLNIIFIIRYFVIITFAIFTPVVASLRVLDKNINGIKVWFGELLSNIFMQSAYAFLFSLYLSFMEGHGWVEQLIWATLIISLGDVIRNMVQGQLTSLAGINESDKAGKIMRGAAGVGGAVAAFATQFKKPMSNNVTSSTNSPINTEASQNNTTSANSFAFNSNNATVRKKAEDINSTSRNLENFTQSTPSFTENSTSKLNNIRSNSNKIGNTAAKVIGKGVQGLTLAATLPIAMGGGQQGINIAKNLSQHTGGLAENMSKPITRGTANVVNTVSSAYSSSLNKSIDKNSPSTVDEQLTMKEKIVSATNTTVEAVKGTKQELKNIGVKNIVKNIGLSALGTEPKKTISNIDGPRYK